MSMSQIGAGIVSLPFWACSTTEKQKPCLKPVSILSEAENWCRGTPQALCFQTEEFLPCQLSDCPYIFFFFFFSVSCYSQSRGARGGEAHSHGLPGKSLLFVSSLRFLLLTSWPHICHLSIEFLLLNKCSGSVVAC